MQTPVLLIHFNRPDSTRRQLEALKIVAPQRVWILCDGPRAGRSGEAEKVAEVRAMLDELPWPCEVKRLYREHNLGCFKNISAGISWFLNDCEAGIILEDDILPDPSFFRFCQELLTRYADSPEVFAIAGHNRRSQPLDLNDDYGFSNYFQCWGWATWKRAWDHFDPTLSGWRDQETWNSICARIFHKLRARLYWTWMFGQVDQQRRDTWASRFLLTIWKQSGCAIIPRLNLTENIGFNSEGTHTAHFSGQEVTACQQSFPLRHPHQITVNPVIDRWFEDGFHSKSLLVRLRWLYRKARVMFHTYS